MILLKKQNIVALLLCCFCGTVVAGQTQSDKIRPTWVDGFLPIPTNDTYIFERKTAQGGTLDEARSNCYQQIVDNSTNMAGAVVYADYVSNKNAHQHYSNGRLQEEIDYIYQSNSYSKGDKHKLYAICVDEYWEYKHGMYYVTRLYAKSELHGKPIFDEVEYNNKYGVEGLVRSLVPGWGQIYKGSKIKGGLIIAGEALGIGGIVLSYSMKASYEKLMKEDPKHMKDYSRSADMWQNIGYGAIAFTAAVYIYNLIDAAVAPGARRVIVLPRQNALTIAPAFTTEGSVGLAMKYNF